MISHDCQQEEHWQCYNRKCLCYCHFEMHRGGYDRDPSR